MKTTQVATITDARQHDLLGVQALRAIAALLVVAYHAVDQWTSHRPGYVTGIDYWPNGSAGVDIFFVISGLVMTLSVQRNATRAHPAWSFIKDRIIRIVPLYWVITTLKIAVVVAIPALATRTRLDPLYVAGSYFLLPVHDWTGVIRPVLPVGWTLTYEMFFYILVAVSLFLRVPLARVCVPMLLLVVAIACVAPPEEFANTMVAEFIFGIVIGRSIPWLRSLPPSVGTIVGVAGFATLLMIPVLGGILRPLTWGLPAACVVAAVVALEMPARKMIPRWLLAAGNASYATYLTHGFVVPAVFILCAKSISVDWAGVTATIILSLVISLIVGQAVHHFIEQPLLLRLRTRRPISTITAPG
jgi:exopolysaccharide production protein ExoZ